MKKALKIFRKVFLWLLVVAIGLFVLLMIGIQAFDRYLATEKGAKWVFKNAPVAEKEVVRTKGGVRYVKLGNPVLPKLLLIHGAPGSLLDWRKLANSHEIYSKYQLIVVERPGYGGTKPGKAEPSVIIQAERMLEVLEEIGPAEVLGHSYGAPIALAMGALKPDLVLKIYGVSGAYDPNDEITFKISYLIRLGIFKYLLPGVIWTSNEEKLGHPAALIEAEHLFRQVRVPVLLIHGDKDTLVPFGNSLFAQKIIPGHPELVVLNGYNHPIHFTDPELLIDILMKESEPVQVAE